ncbi:hypothetical protein EYF80_004415 [Liparis tanakae]|uniref:Uncharacterized protein n=1 Tax=Liparis tanakae TaxID=230148 RepID=A0A4Z2J745_9TELE|nr:hypothetical protein EYF80_004415 [Liparis tanakae]
MCVSGQQSTKVQMVNCFGSRITPCCDRTSRGTDRPESETQECDFKCLRAIDPALGFLVRLTPARLGPFGLHALKDCSAV